VLRWIITAVLLAAPSFGADWIEYRSGPFHVFSDAGDRRAREALNTMEQLRYVLGGLIGKEGLGKSDLTTIWPIDVVLFANQREYGPHVLPKPLVDGGSATLAAWTGDTPLPRDLLRALTGRLIEDTGSRMPEPLETALCDLLSTIQVNGTHVSVGAPLPSGELSGARLRLWAKLQMLETLPEYSGKLRIYLNNLLQAGEEDAAVRNAFDTTPAKLDAQVDAYVRADKFEAAPVGGRALNPNRDFIEKNVERPAVDALVAELGAGGNNFPPDSPRGLLAKNTQSSLELAAKANPRWAEPHFKMAALTSDPAMKIAHLKTAASLDPRNAGYWQTLAETQAGVKLYADAEKSWTAAERAAASPADRARIHQAKLDLEDQRAAFEIAERKRVLEEEARDLERVKNAAAAEVHAAEQAANQRLGANGASIQNPVPWFGDGTGEKVSGTLTRVECLKGPLRLTIQPETGAPVRLMIRDPKQLTVAANSGDAEFPCGAQKPARQVEVQHNAKPDAKLGTAGDIAVIKFPE
jgi:hypothetical protein